MTNYVTFGLFVFAGALAVSPAQAADDTSVGILAGLGVTAASGKTEMGDGAGSLEGTALTIAPARQVGEKIAGKVANEKYVVLLAGDEKFDFAPYKQANARIGRLEEATKLLALACLSPSKPSASGGKVENWMAIDTSATGIASALIGATKIDTSIKGFDVTNPNTLLINAIAGELKLRAILPGELGPGDYAVKDGLARRFERVAKSIEDFEGCLASDSEASDAKKKAAALRAALDSLTASKDATPSLLEAAIALEPIAKATSTLRVDAMKTGGNLITRSNIFLQFGFPGAVTIRGGMVANWRLTDPLTGTVKASGTEACMTAEKDLAGVAVSKGKAKLYCSTNGMPFAVTPYTAGTKQPQDADQKATP